MRARMWSHERVLGGHVILGYMACALAPLRLRSSITCVSSHAAAHSSHVCLGGARCVREGENGYVGDDNVYTMIQVEVRVFQVDEQAQHVWRYE
ncbi:hypothetical protein BDV93DRAFT_524603 [Ceratobasidium sp. AG-I]|nr:hypothetical protein BDV93DRAFT_524603 [Ceratobasidium sp. AG-I]